MIDKYAVVNEKPYVVETGEVISNEEYLKELQKHTQNQFRDNLLKAIEIGEELKFILMKDKRGNEYSTLKIKGEYEFVKVFTVSKREIKKSSNLSKIAKAAWFDLESEIYFPTNTVVIEGKSPSMEDLCEFLDLKKSKLYEVLKELENVDLIKREKINGQLVIYINPYLYNRGFVDYDTIQMFNDSSYNPANRK